MISSNNDDIKLFYHKEGGGNTCWLQAALVLIQGEKEYIKKIQNYNEIYRANVDSVNINDRLEAKLMQSIHNFLNHKTADNISAISKSYQDYIKYKNNDTSASNQQDIDFSVGATYDATTFLGHIEEILGEKVNFALQKENRLVLNQGDVVGSASNINDRKYILSYTQRHWIAYKKEGNQYVEYNTSFPEQRNRYNTLEEIINNAKGYTPFQSNHYQRSNTLFSDFNQNKYHSNNHYQYDDINPYQPYTPSFLRQPTRDFPESPFIPQPQFYPVYGNNYDNEDSDYFNNLTNTPYQPQYAFDYPTTLQQEDRSQNCNNQQMNTFYQPNSWHSNNTQTDDNDDVEEIKTTNNERPQEPVYTPGQKVIIFLAYLCGIFTGILVHYLFYKKFKEPKELAIEEYEKKQKEIKNKQSSFKTNNVNNSQAQGNSK